MGRADEAGVQAVLIDPWADVRELPSRPYDGGSWEDWKDYAVDLEDALKPLRADADALLAVVRAVKENREYLSGDMQPVDDALAALPEHLKAP